MAARQPFTNLCQQLARRSRHARVDLHIHTTFSDGAGHTLAPGSISSVAQACHTGSTCTQATSSGFTYPLTLSSTATKFFSAASQTGLGKVDVTPTVSVAIPGNAYAGTYTSTVTIAAATGP